MINNIQQIIIQDNVCRLYYIRDLIIHSFGTHEELHNKSPLDTEGQLHYE